MYKHIKFIYSYRPEGMALVSMVGIQFKLMTIKLALLSLAALIRLRIVRCFHLEYQ